MDKRVIINCVIIILIWICNRMAYYYLSGNTSLIVSGIILIIGCLSTVSTSRSRNRVCFI